MIRNEKEWQAIDDARVLTQMQELSSDKSRMQAAVKQLKKQQEEAQRALNFKANAIKAYGGKVKKK